jgi:hypothetical protein
MDGGIRATSPKPPAAGGAAGETQAADSGGEKDDRCVCDELGGREGKRGEWEKW